MTPVVLPPTLSARLRDSDWRVLVTGASGWVGRAALELLAHALGAGGADLLANVLGRMMQVGGHYIFKQDAGACAGGGGSKPAAQWACSDDGDGDQTTAPGWVAYSSWGRSVS